MEHLFREKVWGYWLIFRTWFRQSAHSADWAWIQPTQMRLHSNFCSALFALRLSGSTSMCRWPFYKRHSASVSLSITIHYMKIPKVPCSMINVFICWCGSVEVKALCYKPDVSGFETRWGEWIFSIYPVIPAALGPVVHSASNRN
jgi:hypothetical protein